MFVKHGNISANTSAVKNNSEHKPRPLNETQSPTTPYTKVNWSLLSCRQSKFSRNMKPETSRTFDQNNVQIGYFLSRSIDQFPLTLCANAKIYTQQPSRQGIRFQRNQLPSNRRFKAFFGKAKAERKTFLRFSAQSISPYLIEK